MWESLNTLYWSIRGDDAPARFEESPDDFYRQVMTGSMLFQGLTDQTWPTTSGGSSRSSPSTWSGST